jgi:dTDP-4-amino-4,6-dideoxygalactose transaminase
MLVSPFGIRQDWGAALEVCGHHNAAIIVDSAAGLGVSRTPGRARADMFEVFSLHATKPFGIGEGGVVFCARSREPTVRSALNFAFSTDGESQSPPWGINGKMSEFHAAVGLTQINRVDDAISARIRFVERYRNELSQHPVLCPEDAHSAPWQFYPVLMPSADAAKRFIDLAAMNGVEIRRYYRPALSQWPGTERFEACCIAEDLAERLCVLPVRTSSESVEATEITQTVLDAMEQALAFVEKCN